MHKPHTLPPNGHPKGSDMSNVNDASRMKTNEKFPRKQSSWLKLPAPIRQLFDTFPLITYDENQLPQRVDVPRNRNTLHIFALTSCPSATELSLNPACLKWQAYLLVNQVPFSIVSANNHASPSGALPFVLPMISSSRDPQPQVIASAKIYRWALSQGVREEVGDLRLDAYMSLIDVHIRNAWLYCLYLQDRNFVAVAKRLYIQPASSNTLVQFGLAYQLKQAAREELLRSRVAIDEQEILGLAEEAFESLSACLGEDLFFSRNDYPSLFDLALFSYSHPLLTLGRPVLDEAGSGGTFSFQWQEDSLLKSFQKRKVLVKHHENILRLCSQT